jgi:hypothetical protein
LGIFIDRLRSPKDIIALRPNLRPLLRNLLITNRQVFRRRLIAFFINSAKKSYDVLRYNRMLVPSLFTVKVLDRTDFCLLFDELFSVRDDLDLVHSTLFGIFPHVHDILW